MTRWAERLGFALLAAGLRRQFRRIVWLGDFQLPPPGRPVILYSNHHAFYDGQILGHICHEVLQRPALLWFQEGDRFPFFRSLGAMPFPKENGARRAGVVRQTMRLMAGDPRTVMIYFPEGRLHPWEEGLDWSPDTRIDRLAKLIPQALWWPVGLRVSGWHEHRPIAYLAGGAVHEGGAGDERQRLERVLAQVEQPQMEPQRIILEGRRGPQDRWNFSILNPLFARFL